MAQDQNPQYDEALARELGADDYGMKMYTFVLLTTGDRSPDDQALVAAAFAGHMANIDRLAREGKLLVAGPFGPNGDAMRGLFIFDSGDVDQVQEWLADDPAIAEGILKASLYPWYGSAALPSYLELADKLWKEKP
ncbi:YciI family protein [Lunatimonas salinarum]|uniref:YciI family protein n=1 Tax=Lunatimonas salinarum TaxID=1774590 RepID=UPI001FD8169E|nr:YciI family protein [Lunatimonas salinarum]